MNDSMIRYRIAAHRNNRIRSRKRFSAFILAFAFIISAAFTGCRPGSASPAAAEASGLEGKKIGMTIMVDDGLFATMRSYLSVLADAAGVELIFDIGAFSPEDQVESIKRLVAEGCDGILFCNFGDECLTKVAQICDEAKVFWVQYGRDITDQDIAYMLDASDYYVGRTFEDFHQVGVDIADTFYEMGLEKTAIIGPTPGENTTDGVDEGYKERAKEHGMEILAEVRNCEDADDCTKAVYTILSGFPETEAIIVLSGTTGKLEGVLEGLKDKERLGRIAVGSLDATKTIGEDIKAGYVDISFTGQYVDSAYAFALLLNAVAGTPLSDETIVIKGRYVVLRSQSDAEKYEKYVEDTENNVYAYTGEEFCRWLKVYNPDAGLEMISDAASIYGLEDIMERHNHSEN